MDLDVETEPLILKPKTRILGQLTLFFVLTASFFFGVLSFPEKEIRAVPIEEDDNNFFFASAGGFFLLSLIPALYLFKTL